MGTPFCATPFSLCRDRRLRRVAGSILCLAAFVMIGCRQELAPLNVVVRQNLTRTTSSEAQSSSTSSPNSAAPHDPGASDDPQRSVESPTDPLDGRIKKILQREL